MCCIGPWIKKYSEGVKDEAFDLMIRHSSVMQIKTHIYTDASTNPHTLPLFLTNTHKHPLMWSPSCDIVSGTEKQLRLASRWNSEPCRWIRQQKAGRGSLDNAHSLFLCVFSVIAGQQHSLIKTLAAIDSKGRKWCCFDFRCSKTWTLPEKIYA